MPDTVGIDIYTYKSESVDSICGWHQHTDHAGSHSKPNSSELLHSVFMGSIHDKTFKVDCNN